MRLLRVLAASVVLSALPACSSSHPSSGDLVVDWTIENTKDASLCDQTGAASIDVNLSYESDGTSAGEFVQDCTFFATSITLRRGTYFGDARLIDVNGADVTTPVDLGVFDILGDDQLTIPIDFPFNSFL